MVCGDFVLQFFDFVVFEFDDFVIVYVDYVVVVVVMVQFVDCLVVFEIVFEYEVGGFELGQYLVYCGQVDFVVMFQQLVVDVFGGYVVLGIVLFEQCQDLYSWMGYFQVDFMQVVGFYRFLFIGDLVLVVLDWVVVVCWECIIGLIFLIVIFDV